MRISEAIREGAKRGPQLFGELFDRTGRSCALGAAVLTLGLFDVNQLALLYPVLLYPVLTDDATSPCGCSPRMIYLSLGVIGSRTATSVPIWLIIVHLNNYHRWTRERIADQVEIWEREAERAHAGSPLTGIDCREKREPQQIQSLELDSLREEESVEELVTA